jgi:ribosomal protein S18 acetylase RimI-like enzyme
MPAITTLGKKISLRQIMPKDTTFLYQVYASTRQEELAVLDWDAAQKEEFLKTQFEAQHNFYMENFSEAAFNILVYQAEDAGRLYFEYREDEIRIIDIALLPEFRNQGIGTNCMKEILEMGKVIGKPVRIHVERNNPAMSLYKRLGFQIVSENGVYFLMEKTPGDLHGGLHA